MFEKARKLVVAAGAVAALAMGGSALADAASTDTIQNGTAATAATAPDRDGPGRHVGPNGQREEALTGDTASKVEAAAEAKLPGGTVERVETDADHGSPYEAHVRKADGTEVEVLVNEAFEVTAVNEMGHR